jgi:hypothetical protein
VTYNPPALNVGKLYVSLGVGQGGPPSRQEILLGDNPWLTHGLGDADSRGQGLAERSHLGERQLHESWRRRWYIFLGFLALTNDVIHCL